ncbi:cupredoxin domain-containing protein [Candidatus Woesebacteria bacterium]|nr:cupredoxin domain-containing protein [Candidatus Woesebacteria bacterium]
MQLKYIALVLVSGVVFSGCSLLPAKEQTVPVQPMETQVEETPANDESAMETTEPEAMMAEGKVVQVTANDFTYDVKEIRVKQGEKLTVSMMNSEGFHDFIIDELAVDSGKLKEGESIQVEIPTDKPGTYEYYCSVGQHRQMGMKGMLIIE